MIRKIALSILLAASSAVAMAQTSVDTRGLDDAQIAEIKAIAAKKVAETAAAKAGGNVGDLTTGVTLAATWGQQAATAAEGFAKAMGIAARELNVTINDFLKSPAGILTAVIVIWKMMGASILGFVYAMVVLAVGLTMVRIIYTRLFTASYKSVPYKHFFGLLTGEKLVRIPKGFNDLENDGEWLAFWVMVLLTIITLGFAGGIIF